MSLYNKDDRFLLLRFCNPRNCTNRFYNISYFIINRQLKLKYVYFLSPGSHYHLFFSLFRLKLKWLKNGVKTGAPISRNIKNTDRWKLTKTFFQLIYLRNSSFFMYVAFQKMFKVSWEDSFKTRQLHFANQLPIFN